MSFPSVAQIPIPDDLSDIDRVEFLACRGALAQLELEWLSVTRGDHPDLQLALTLLLESKAVRDNRAKERLELRIDVEQRHAAHQRERIALDCELAKEALRERVIRGYFQKYQKICGRIGEVMAEIGEDFEEFIKTNRIEFPPIAGDDTIRGRLQTVESVAVALPAEEGEKDLRQIIAQFGDLD
jgi:hypothetical protein